MRNTNVCIGIESHLHTILDVMEQLRTLVNTENDKIIFEGQAPAVLNDNVLQDKKMRLFQKFETLARIVGRISAQDVIEDKDLVRIVIRGILEMRRIITINSILMQNHLVQRRRLLSAIMDGIEEDSAAKKNHAADREQIVCR